MIVYRRTLRKQSNSAEKEIQISMQTYMSIYLFVHDKRRFRFHKTTPFRSFPNRLWLSVNDSRKIQISFATNALEFERVHWSVAICKIFIFRVDLSRRSNSLSVARNMSSRICARARGSITRARCILCVIHVRSYVRRESEGEEKRAPMCMSKQ